MTSLVLVVCFMSGVLFESIRLLQFKLNRTEWGKYVVCVLLAGATTLIVDLSHWGAGDWVFSSLIIAAFIFTSAFALMFQERLLLPMNWYNLGILNIVGLYVAWQHFPNLAIGLAVISVLLSWLAFRPTLSNYWKVALYAWGLVLLLGVVIIPSSINPLQWFEIDYWLQQSPWAVLLSGMVTTYCIVYSWYLFKLIPIPRKSQSFAARMHEWHQDIQLMSSRFSALPSKPLLPIIILIGCTTVAILNINYHFIPDVLLINLMIILAYKH